MRYIIGFLLTIGLIIVALILIFRGGGTSTTLTGSQVLSQYANNSTTDVRLTIDGPVNSPQEHRQIRITVSQNQITADVLQGYNSQVLRSNSYVNDPTSYVAFLRSLQLAGYTKGITTATARDERGYCPTGDRFIYEVITGNQSDKQRFWYTSCGQGSYKGNSQLTNVLFKAQVPDYDTLTGDVQL
jgi:hypothetical protein